MEWYIFLAVIAIGFAAGFINTLAGGGSILTLPMLIFLGLPANVANGTNRVVMILQNLVATGSFRHRKVLDFRAGIRLSLPAVVGSVIGAVVAVNLNEEIMEKIIGGLLIFMFFLILYKPDKWLKEHAGGSIPQARPGILQVVIFFLIGLYGGFIQAGVGFFLLAALVLGAGIDLVRANSVKVLVILVYNLFALAVFLFNGQVVWSFGLLMGAGSMAGAYVGTLVAVSWGPRFIRYVLLVTIIVSAAKLMGWLDPLFGG